jgi:beta-lactamase class A
MKVMTSTWSRVGIAIALAGLTTVGAAAIGSADGNSAEKTHSAKPAPAKHPRATKAAVHHAPKLPKAPKAISDRIDEIGRQFDGRVGIAVKSIDDGWETGWKDDELYPQQSVSKLWVAITALQAVDKGKVSLDDKVTLTKSDLTLFHQPIAAEVLKDGSYTTTLGDLLVRAITTSDNTANDKLMRSVGGPPVVRSMIERENLGSIRFANGERSLQSKIAGMSWSQKYSLGGKFFEAREALPIKHRSEAFLHYIADPYDGAAPSAVVAALAKLKKGQLLSPSSTAKLLNIMGNTHTGPNRLKGGLKDGWSLSHKTGTGQELGGVQAGYNDIAILTAPDGRSYGVAVMIKKTSVPLIERMEMMHEVVEAVMRQHDRTTETADAL